MSPAKISVQSVMIGWIGAIVIYAIIDAVLWPREWFDWLFADIFLSLLCWPMFIVLGVSLAAIHYIVPQRIRFWNPVSAVPIGAAIGSGVLYVILLLYTAKRPVPTFTDNFGAYAGALVFGIGVWLRRKYPEPPNRAGNLELGSGSVATAANSQPPAIPFTP